MNKKINGFSKNQGQLAEKNKFKASAYMGEINERESEMLAARNKLIDQEEEMRNMSVAKEKLTLERDYLVHELKTLDQRFKDMQTKFNDQARLLASVCTHSKNPAAGLNYLNNEMTQDGQSMTNQDKAREESMRADRIARQMNRSSFMGLGENPPKLYSETDPTQASRPGVAADNVGAGGVFQDKDQTYLTDDSIPSGIYALIDTYREKARNARPGNQLALLIDDFFGEAHSIMKDANLREIARIKNENAVEVTKLKKTIESMQSNGFGVQPAVAAKGHHTAFKV